MQEVSGAVTLQQVPEAHKKMKTLTQLHHHTFKHTFNNLSSHRRHTKVQRNKLTLRDPHALLFCSSRFNWGFEPGSCLSHCDKLKIALWQVSENPVGIRLCILCQMGWLAQGLQTQKETNTVTLRPMLGHVPLSYTSWKGNCLYNCTLWQFFTFRCRSPGNRQRVCRGMAKKVTVKRAELRETEFLLEDNEAIMQAGRRVQVNWESLPLLLLLALLQ